MEQHPVIRFFKKILKAFRLFASFAVNYGLYYLRRGLLFETEQQARNLTNKQYKLYLLSRGESTYEDFIKTTEGENATVTEAFSTTDITDDNLHVNGLWIGNTLSKIELLTIYSFANCGHIFHLWTYGKFDYNFPPGVVIEDANDIIPYEKVFRYKHTNKYGHGKGSVSGFSDIFRYKLLYEKGGWWVDMDVTCVKPLNFSAPYFFRLHHQLEVVGNVIKCPPKSDLMLACYNEASATVNEENTDWHKPIEILNKYIAEKQLQNYIYRPVSNLDIWSELVGFAIGDTPLPKHYRFVHWMNEEWRSRDIDKNTVRYRSTLGKLMLKAGLLQMTGSRLRITLNNMKHMVLLRIFYW